MRKEQKQMWGVRKGITWPGITSSIGLGSVSGQHGKSPTGLCPSEASTGPVPRGLTFAGPQVSRARTKSSVAGYGRRALWRPCWVEMEREGEHRGPQRLSFLSHVCTPD